MRVRIRSVLVLFAVGVLVLAAATVAVRAADPDAIWKIVHERCVPDQQLNNDPAPCASVSLIGGEAGGHAILKDIRGATQFLLIPTARLSGIESPEILAADAPNYFAAAWAARPAMERVLHRVLPREDVSLAINSRHSRSQEQLHIHIDCLRPDVVATLHAQAAAIGPAWQPLSAPLLGHPYRARWVPAKGAGDGLETVNPFKLLAEAVGAAAMAEQTLVVAGAVSADGAPGFVLLADRYDPASGDRAGGEELQDHDCAVGRPGG